MVYYMVCKLIFTYHIFLCSRKEKKMNQLTLSECSKRRLDETYIVVYAIKNEINIKKGRLHRKKRYLHFNRNRR